VHALLVINIKLQTKFEVHSFTHSKDVIGEKNLNGHVTLATPILGLPSQG